MQVPAAPVPSIVQQFAPLGIRLEGWLTILAVIVGPILALWAQCFSERRGELKQRKLRVFSDLMATRGTRLSGRHVEALNAIQVEFHAKRGQERVVFEKWKEYLDHLNKKVDPK